METIEIPLTRGKIAIIDASDFELVSKFNWYVCICEHTCYARSTSRSLGMHRLIMAIDDSHILVDHRDGNGLNNTRANLRMATTLENCLNQKKLKGISRFKGVCLMPAEKRVRRWVSRIKTNGRRILLGYFLTEEEAARAYDAAALSYFGEFAKLNFPPPAIGA